MRGGHNKTHGMTKAIVYSRWQNMRRRCYDTKRDNYPEYGGKGIKVCERWESFENFLTDMGPMPSSQHTIDRYPNQKGDYEPGNCRWATVKEQQRNRSSNNYILYRGKKMTVPEAIELSGTNILPCTVRKRIRLGWLIKDAIERVPTPNGVYK